MRIKFFIDNQEINKINTEINIENCYINKIKYKFAKIKSDCAIKKINELPKEIRVAVLEYLRNN